MQAPEDNAAMDAAMDEPDQLEEDDTPEFLDPNDAVEVHVDAEDDVPMEEEDEAIEEVADLQEQEQVVDMSRLTISTHTDSVYTVDVHSQGSKLLISSGSGDEKAYLHHVTGPNQVESKLLDFPHTDTVSSVAFNLTEVDEKTPKMLAVGAYDGNLLLYDPETGAQQLKLEGPSDIEWVSFHPKGGSVILCGSGDGTVWMFHLPLQRCLQVFVGHEGAVTSGAFTPDGKLAVTASGDCSLRVWGPKTGKNKHVFRFDAALMCMAQNDAQLILVGAEDGAAHVCHVGTKKVLASLRHYEAPAAAQEDMELPMSVEAVGFSQSHPTWCATGGLDGNLKIWDLTSGQCRHTCTPPQGGSVTRLEWHPTLPLVFTSTSRGRIHIWDARNGGLLRELTGHAGAINDMSIEFHGAINAIVATAGDDKTVRVFEVDIQALFVAPAVTGA